ncbi:MAG TPA: DoxX family protein [Terriglobia bacterium]|nr:DoxX family protein [Terriglobia bacterium]
MKTTLWTAQVVWGVIFSVSGLGKILCYQPALWNQATHQVPWFSAVPQGLFVFIGICEFLGGVGLILPAMTGFRPRLTPIAAIGLTAVMILAALFHIERGEYYFLPINLGLAGVAAFIAYGRLYLRPIAASALNPSRVLKGLTVLSALVLVDFAPVLYRLAHTH